MKRLITSMALVLAPFGALAQVTDMTPTCLPNAFTQYGVHNGVAWLTWQCRAPSTQRYWYRFYAFHDLNKPAPGSGEVYDKAVKGDATALAAGAKLRTDSIYSARFAPAKRMADAAAANQKPVATFVQSGTGLACACDVRHKPVGKFWACPLATDVNGPDANCQVQ